jgi:hypothetical protein
MAIRSPSQTSRNVTIRQSPAFQIADYALPIDGEFGAAEGRRTTGNVLATCHVAAMSSIAVAERTVEKLGALPDGAGALTAAAR